MISTEQILLIQIMEECAEVQQAISKYLRFGSDEVYPETNMTNKQRLDEEIDDLYGLINEAFRINLISPRNKENQYLKAEKFYKYLEYSKQLGIVTP